jgi:hypothetical protein
MPTSRSDLASRLSEAVWERFGEPEVVYKPAPGQTFAGVLLGLLFASMACAGAFVVDGANLSGRVLIATLAVPCVAFAYWWYRLGNWRLAICPRGLVQVRAWAVDKVPWSQVRELVETRVKGTGSRQKLTVLGPWGEMVVRPLNCRGTNQIYDVLLDAARRRQIAIRTEWYVPPD